MVNDFNEKNGIKKRLLDFFPVVLEGIREILESMQYFPEETEKLLYSIKRNTLGGKNNRGLAVLQSLTSLINRELEEAEFRDAALLGWLIEILQGCFLMADDIMDQSIKRRGLDCWYLVVGVRRAINESQLLEACIPLLIRKYFRNMPYYVDLLDTFREVTFLTELGQQEDLLSSRDGEASLRSFDLMKYDFIITYKTSFYSFYLPIKCALLLSRNSNQKAYDTTIKLSKLLGYYFQVQDDYLDCFGDYTVLGKVGMDIQDNKCTWLVCYAEKFASADQLNLLRAHYGKAGSENIAVIKQLYHELQIPELYHKFEDDMVDSISKEIDLIDESTGLKKCIFTKFFQLIYKRSR
ncbi:ER farnesyl pyrophosphate synthetase Erg20 [Schizosaccharomyces pombe]|uniref:Geranylgeranyl pyrophosphate synthase n=1 Tax=Schizosaccharomyces pombe (strain 972 / ATCC 24843) TaxID=284812 RepID=GGPPS_SCHPO|nr:farnesyl pyrophosphate synthetase [Schizosaccharomyces pombe]O59703.1 RecName: Full=Geranylgeranyl pyrophosphate synthase; Short=GGPP synthase; Short=GGPPSase; AltName: Full=(2E,6E)-farnesyl diphosphate synthase; AltName: Full=Dimethylallyltranstransferase; AltName: Full=Farnesyl diphosphate synthase; AltName: Full=Farnesyltranstransferase; AltName: Full=Geranylgeranyl diphosphate synthase; AltName: Full=Geranyltranstransferase; AltName: Full=Sporulation-specific protein 9 [Schizosaccharomyces |eukprot:NP_595334.1 farnesyl pyrophosphate synthetase [Schizosaccharomyces pombe]